MKQVSAVAGSNCNSGAEIQADLRTFPAHGVLGMSAIVVVVVENTSRVVDIQGITLAMITSQTDVVLEDAGVDTVKVGMLSTPACMTAATDKLKQYRPPHTVIDPVMYTKNGCPLVESDAVSSFITTILPLADVLTPNIPEVKEITGMTIPSVADMEAVTRWISRMGCQVVIIKGRHSSGNALDVLLDGIEIQYFETERIHTKNTHGASYTFSSVITVRLAFGAVAPKTTARVKAYVTTAIHYTLPLGKGNGPAHHFYDLYHHGLPEFEKEDDFS